MNKMSSRLAVIGVGAVIFAAGITGCGGSDDDSGPLSKDDFIAQANQICADFREQSDVAEKAFNAALEEDDAEAAADVFQENADGQADAIDQVEALEPPEEDQETIDEFIALGREQNEAANDAADALRAEDQAAANEALTAGAAADKESDVIANEYGLTDCAE